MQKLEPPPPLSRIPWPPLLFIGSGLLAWFVNYELRLGFPSFVTLGVILIGAGFCLDLWAAILFWQHKTTINPTGAAKNLISSGAFRTSRNPIYVGNTVVVIGLGLFSGNPWMFIAAIVAATLTYQLSIKREEAYMAAKFDAEWQAYAAKTPRWLGF
jgi:protein-S-isoprenylcysteine O-methyltransferase Ste14